MRIPFNLKAATILSLFLLSSAAHAGNLEPSNCRLPSPDSNGTSVVYGFELLSDDGLNSYAAVGKLIDVRLKRTNCEANSGEARNCEETLKVKVLENVIEHHFVDSPGTGEYHIIAVSQDDYPTPFLFFCSGAVKK